MGALLRLGTRVGLAWLAFAAALLVLGYVLVGAGGVGPAHLLDLPVARFLAHHRPPLGVPLANVAPLLLAPFAVLAAVRLIRPLPGDVSRWRALGALGLSVAGAYGLVLVAKSTFARPRPPRILAAIADTGYSFPSAHVAVVAATCVAIVTTFPIRNLRRRVVWVACAATVVIAAVARLVLGVHWLTDVAVGALLGSAWAGCASWLATRSPARHAAARRAAVRPRQRLLVAGSSLAALLLLAPVGWSVRAGPHLPRQRRLAVPLGRLGAQQRRRLGRRLGRELLVRPHAPARRGRAPHVPRSLRAVGRTRDPSSGPAVARHRSRRPSTSSPTRRRGTPGP